MMKIEFAEKLKSNKHVESDDGILRILLFKIFLKQIILAKQ